MQGKVTMSALVCYHCGRDRLTLALAPWKAKVVICKSCKQMSPLEVAGEMATTEAEAKERGLPKGKAPVSNGEAPPAEESSNPPAAPEVAPDVPPAAPPEERSTRRRRAATE
jgi:hypothetical protein